LARGVSAWVARAGGARGDRQVVEFETVRSLALALPEVEEGTWYGTPAFKVRGRSFARLREDGLLVLRVDPGLREVLIRERPDAYLVTPHYQDYPYVLVRLGAVDGEELGDLLADGWAEAAPKKLAAGFAAGRSR